MRHCTRWLRCEKPVAFVELSTQVAETHKGAERPLLSSLGTCPGITTYHVSVEPGKPFNSKSWEHVPMFLWNAMDQYLQVPFLGWWTSIYQLFWGSPGVQGFDPSPCIRWSSQWLFRTDSGHFRTQKMWSWPKSDFTCFHPRCYFSVSSTSIVKKRTQGGWRLLLVTPFMVQTRAQNWINHDKHSTIHY